MKIFINNILFSIIICVAILYYKNNKSNIPVKEIIIYSFGLGPALVSIICFWGIFLFPNKSDFFYFSIVIILNSLLLYPAILYIIRQYPDFKINLLLFCQKFKLKSKSVKKVYIIGIFSILLLAIIIPSIFFYARIYFAAPLAGHDVQMYATEGKIFYNEKTFEYKYSGYYPQLNFTGFSKHAPGFSLLLTWEKILNNLFHLDTNPDYYFKSISPYYGFLILLTAFYWLSRTNLLLAFLGMFAFFSSFFFTKTFLFNHIDTFRIYFLSVSWIMLARYLKEKDRLSLALLGIFSGFSAFTHSIGAFVACFNCLALLLFLDEKLFNKIKYAFAVFLIIVIFGGFHYIYDTFWGRGWIFK